jgi:hypothetical protein
VLKIVWFILHSGRLHDWSSWTILIKIINLSVFWHDFAIVTWNITDKNFHCFPNYNHETCLRPENIIWTNVFMIGDFVFWFLGLLKKRINQNCNINCATWWLVLWAKNQIGLLISNQLRYCGSLPRYLVAQPT